VPQLLSTAGGKDEENFSRLMPLLLLLLLMFFLLVLYHYYYHHHYYYSCSDIKRISLWQQKPFAKRWIWTLPSPLMKHWIVWHRGSRGRETYWIRRWVVVVVVVVVVVGCRW